MTSHVFVDESERRSYVMAATYVAPNQLARTRATLRKLLLPGERRMHFKSERDSRRRVILSSFVAAHMRCRIYVGQGPSEAARGRLLEEIVADAVEASAARLVFESRDPAANARDRGVISARTKATANGLVGEHMWPSTEPLLWVSDAIAWSFGAGRDWRKRIESILEAVTHCEES